MSPLIDAKDGIHDIHQCVCMHPVYFSDWLGKYWRTRNQESRNVPFWCEVFVVLFGTHFILLGLGRRIFLLRMTQFGTMNPIDQIEQ
jgi:hypothetical protein